MVDGLEQDFAGRLQVIALDFGDRDERAAAQALGTRVHPSIVLVSAAGAIVQVIPGAQTEEDLRPVVEALVSGEAE
ncbi:MAG: hypothetical protein Kow0010_15200 [Dehalococcoidia bacterium]